MTVPTAAQPDASEETSGSETETEAVATDAGTDAVAVPAQAEPAEAEEIVTVAEGAKEELAAQGDTIAALVETLDSWALVIGSFRISVVDVIILLGTIGLVVTAAWFLARVARRLIRRVSSLDGAQALLAEKISTILIWTAAFFVTIDVIGIDLTALAIFGGAFGLAIGFGLQKTFGNLISGILLLLDKSIKPGDVISVTDQAGNEAVGQIRRIGIRAISVITRDQTEHLIPNENLMVNQVVNWSYSSRDVRVKAPIGVSYDSDLKLVSELLHQAVSDIKRVLTTPKPSVNLMGFGDNSVDFEVRFWIHDPEDGIANVRSEVYKRIWELFQEHNIEIPYPQRDLHIRTSEQFDQLIAAMGKQK